MGFLSKPPFGTVLAANDPINVGRHLWLLNEGGGARANDASLTNNLPGTLTSLVGNPWNSEGVKLDGTGYINLDTSLGAMSSATSEKTYFIVARTTAGNASLFGNRSAGGAGLLDFQLGFDGVDNNGTGFLSFICRDDGGGGLNHVHSSIAFNDGKYHVYGLTIRSDKLVTMYADGIVQNSFTHTMTAGIATNAFRIGSEPQNSSITPLVGHIKIACVCPTRCLTSQEIARLTQDNYAGLYRDDWFDLLSLASGGGGGGSKLFRRTNMSGLGSGGPFFADPLAA